MINPKLIYDIEHFDDADNFFSIIKTPLRKNPYHIIYGHFFEYENLFIYRSVYYKNLLIRYSGEYNKCKLSDLAKPKFEEYYQFKYFADVYNTVQILNDNYNKDDEVESSSDLS